jgi:hypothetical protein
MSSRKKTKHIKAKFFFIKDRVDNREIRVKDCPTEEMWADIMTKPLQGTAFRVMTAELINYEDPKEIKCNPTVKNPISAGKTVTWKIKVATSFRAPQECIGQNRILAKKPTTDRQISRTRCTHGDTGHKASTALGTARLVRRPWKLGETSNKIPNQ